MLEEIVPLEPVHFFAIQVECHYLDTVSLEKKHLLPDLASFYDTSSFAEVALGWHESGIYARIKVKGRFDEPEFPNFSAGDSVELFFDTRDVKTTGYTTRFCHHFYFLPVPVKPDGEAIVGGEATHFRTDDVHPLCSPTQLQVESSVQKKEVIMNIFIPSECLHGYDSSQFGRLGFTYRINRVDGSRQYFSASGADFTIESQPSLWASLKLIKEVA